MILLKDQAQKAIGAVVVNGQLFECAFVLCAKLALAQDHISDLSQIKPLSESSSFKQPTKAVLNELRGRVELDPDFESKLSSIVDRRHELIHRWVIEPGWPNSSEDLGWRTAEQFATQLSTDLDALTRILLETINDWCQRFPTMADAWKPFGSDWRSALPEAYRTLRVRKA